MGMEHAYTYAAAALIDQVDRALSAVEGEPARAAVEQPNAHSTSRVCWRPRSSSRASRVFPGIHIHTIFRPDP